MPLTKEQEQHLQRMTEGHRTDDIIKFLTDYTTKEAEVLREWISENPKQLTEQENSIKAFTARTLTTLSEANSILLLGLLTSGDEVRSVLHTLVAYGMFLGRTYKGDTRE